MKEDAIFLLDRLAEFTNEADLDDHGLRIWVGHVEPAIARLRRAVFASVAQDIDPRAEIERLQESVRNKTSLLDRQLGTPCEQIRHAEEVATLTALARLAGDLRAQLTAAQTENEKLLEALEPSGDTKAAYMGEFTFSYRAADEEGEEVTCTQYVPWDTVKEIMKAIRLRALTTQPSKTETRDEG